MNKVIRFYNQNRRAFWTIIISIILVFVVIQFLEKNYEKPKDNNANSNVITIKNEYENSPIVSGDIIGEEKMNDASILIEQFINYCNNKNIQNAYNMLSMDCKKERYPSIEEFNNNYIAPLFEQVKMYDIQLWKTYNNKYIYLIKLTEDILATGNVNSRYIQDYYTVMQEDGKYKLNINSYIGKENIGIKNEQNEVIINIIEKNVYMETEEYIVQIKNGTSNEICIDKKESTKTMFITSSKNLNYYADLYEIPNNSLVLKPGQTEIYKIKFGKSFRNNEITKRISFKNLILNYKTEKENIVEFKIEL